MALTGDSGCRRRVLVTGADGVIGRVLQRGLGERHDLRGVDLRPRRGSGVARGDMRRLRTVERALAGAEVVVDLAARPSPSLTWEEAYADDLHPAVNVLEAARRVGVRRVVFASSNHVTGLYEREEPYASIVAGRYEGLEAEPVPLLGPDAPTRPDSFYAIAKLAAEATGRYYAEEHGLSVVCLRIGTVLADERPRTPRHFATLLSHADLVSLVDACLCAPAELDYAIVYGVSANRWRFWDVANAADAIDWQPRDDAEAWRELVAVPSLA